MILLRSTSGEKTEDVIKSFDEWSAFWLDWWQPWSYIDVNQNRVIWMRMIGVPLHVWSSSFFGMGCSKFGNMIKLHQNTKHKIKLDEALVKVSTGLASIDRLMRCKIDEACFQIRIEEIRCINDESHLLPQKDVGYELESDSSEEEDWIS